VCEATLLGHNTCTLPLVELSDDRLVRGDNDGKVKVWDLTSLKLVQDIDNEKSKSPGQISFECQGLLLMEDNILLCGNGNKIVAHRPLKVEKEINLMKKFFFAEKRVYEDLPYASFEGHAKIVRILKSLHDGKRFLSGSYDCSIKLWHLDSKSCVVNFLGHQDTVSDIIVYDINTIVSGDQQGILKFWELDTGKTIREIKAHEIMVSSIVLKSDKTLVTTHGVDPILKFWSQ